jgi:hypothetical protein
MPHKFHVGESVILRPAISRNVPGGVYEVTKQLPASSNIALKVQTKSMSALRGKAN